MAGCQVSRMTSGQGTKKAVTENGCPGHVALSSVPNTEKKKLFPNFWLKGDEGGQQWPHQLIGSLPGGVSLEVNVVIMT